MEAPFFFVIITFKGNRKLLKIQEKELDIHNFEEAGKSLFVQDPVKYVKQQAPIKLCQLRCSSIFLN